MTRAARLRSRRCLSPKLRRKRCARKAAWMRAAAAAAMHVMSR